MFRIQVIWHLEIYGSILLTFKIDINIYENDYLILTNEISGYKTTPIDIGMNFYKDDLYKFTMVDSSFYFTNMTGLFWLELNNPNDKKSDIVILVLVLTILIMGIILMIGIVIVVSIITYIHTKKRYIKLSGEDDIEVELLNDDSSSDN